MALSDDELKIVGQVFQSGRNLLIHLGAQMAGFTTKSLITLMNLQLPKLYVAGSIPAARSSA